MSEAQKTDFVADIEDTVRGHVIAQMPADSTGELSKMPLRQLLGVYWTWRERFPAPRPRAVHRSQELDASANAQQYSAKLAELERKMTVGEDLTPHLSERVETAYISETQRPGLHPRQRDADRDRMLNAWGIHHLHLSSAPGGGGFNARGGDLLYAVFRPDDVYLLGIYTHSDWAREELVRVIVRNWPDAGLFLKSNYVQGKRAQFTDVDRRQLRRTNVDEALFEVDGAFYGPPGIGQTAAGGSFAAARRAMDYVENLRQLRENLDSRLSAFGHELDRQANGRLTCTRGESVCSGAQMRSSASPGSTWISADAAASHPPRSELRVSAQHHQRQPTRRACHWPALLGATADPPGRVLKATLRSREQTFRPRQRRLGAERPKRLCVGSRAFFTRCGASPASGAYLAPDL